MRVRKWIRQWILQILMLFGAGLISCSYCDIISTPTTFAGPEFEVEELTANLVSSSILVVNGKVNNKGYREVRGRILIYIKNTSDDVISVVEENINNGMPFSHGQRALFETSIKIDNVPGFNNVSVEFVESKPENFAVPLTPLRKK